MRFLSHNPQRKFFHILLSCMITQLSISFKVTVSRPPYLSMFSASKCVLILGRVQNIYKYFLQQFFFELRTLWPSMRESFAMWNKSPFSQRLHVPTYPSFRGVFETKDEEISTTHFVAPTAWNFLFVTRLSPPRRQICCMCPSQMVNMFLDHCAFFLYICGITQDVLQNSTYYCTKLWNSRADRINNIILQLQLW